MSVRNFELEERIVSYIQGYIDEYSVSPTVREIATYCGCAPSNIQRYIDRLTNEGKLNRLGTRQFETKLNDSPMIHIPLVGVIACGTPILAEQNIQSYIPMRRSIVGIGEFFALTAKGDSMIDAGIEEGDIVIVKIQNYALDGQIVVALIDDEATLKRYYIDRKNKCIRLHPENKKYDDILLKDVLIQGVATKIIKSLE